MEERREIFGSFYILLHLIVSFMDVVLRFSTVIQVGLSQIKTNL